MSAERIEIGINKDVYLKAATINDKDNLILTFDIAGVKRLSGFEALQDDEIQEGTSSLDLRLFPPNVPAADKGTDEKRRELVQKDILKNRSILEHILQGYLPKEQTKLGKALYVNTGIEANNFEEKILDKAVLLVVFKNMTREFIARMRPFLNDESLKFRLKLVRQSKDKHFATLPGTRVNENPFWEDMIIPDAESKVKFTDYEIKEGLDNGTPASKKTDADAAPDTSAPMSAENVFGQ